MNNNREYIKVVCCIIKHDVVFMEFDSRGIKYVFITLRVAQV